MHIDAHRVSDFWNCDQLVIFRNYLLRALSADDLTALIPVMRELTLPAGQVLYAVGGPVEAVHFPSTAVLSVVTRMRDGRSVETATVGFESAVGLLPGLGHLPAPSGIFAQIGGAAISIPAAALRQRAIASPQFMQMVLRFAQSNASQADQSVACNALHNVVARLARWLLMTDDRVGNNMVPLTQEYLAVMVGVQRTTVSAAAAELKAAGLIRYVRGRIEIIDRPGLEDRACECYAVIHDVFSRLGDAQKPAA
jgi:CRP-like cAMP-binding protein